MTGVQTCALPIWVDAVAGEALGGGVRMVFALLLFFMLLLLITVFMVSVAEAFINVPELVIPTFGLVLIAMGMGWLVHRHHIDGRVVGAWGVFLAYGLIWVGNSHPVSLPQEWGPQVVLAVWFAAISAYCLLASVAPIWLILRPRDCISTAKLFIGMLLGFAGLAVARPLMQAPFSTGSFLAGGKPMWPMLFIIVACGAISGFHAVVSTGTTARQLDHEADARPIAFGGMVMEGVLAMLVLLVVAGGLKWGEAPAGVTGRAAELYFATALQENWIVAFGSGFGNLVSKLGIPYLGYAVAALLGSVMVKSFVLTTLDTGTRLARFLVSDGLGARVPLLRGKVAASLVILVPAYVLAVTHSYGSIWRLFGSANQLTAAITLLTATALLGRAKRPTLFTLVPAGFMLATSLAALVWEMFAPGSGSFTAPEKDWLLGSVSLVLLALGVAACIGYWRGVQSAPRAQGMNPLTFKRD